MPKLFMNRFKQGTKIRMLDRYVYDHSDAEPRVVEEWVTVKSVRKAAHNTFRATVVDSAGKEFEFHSDYVQRELRWRMTKAKIDLDQTTDLFSLAVKEGFIVESDGPLVKTHAEFSHEHFPVGTQFTVSEEIARNSFSPDKVFTVAGLIRNGVDSYVIETTETNRQVKGEFSIECIADEPWAINIGYVKSIVKRGQGGIKFTKTSELQLPFVYSDCGSNVASKGRNYVNYNPRQLVYSAYKKFAYRNPSVLSQFFDLDKAVDVLRTASFVKVDRKPRTTIFGRRDILVWSVPRRRLDRWFKQNHNRMLMKIEVAVYLEENLTREERESWEFGED